MVKTRFSDFKPGSTDLSLTTWPPAKKKKKKGKKRKEKEETKFHDYVFPWETYRALGQQTVNQMLINEARITRVSIVELGQIKNLAGLQELADRRLTPRDLLS